MNTDFITISRQTVDFIQPIVLAVCDAMNPERLVLGMALLLVLQWIRPYLVCQAHSVQCMVKDPHSPLHEYHHSGDFVVGEIASHAFILSDQFDFTIDPPPPLKDEVK